MALIRRFHKRSDSAEPQQVDRCHQQASDQLRRGQAIFWDVEGALHLGADWDRFRSALEHTSAGRDQRRIVIFPARTRQAEQPLPLDEALLWVGIGIDEDMKVVESAKEPKPGGHKKP